MRQPASRIRALTALLGILVWSGIPGVLAETNTLQGSVQAEELPTGCAVRATPAADAVEASGPRFAALDEQGTFRFFDLPAGSWTLEVVTPTGVVLPPVEGAAPVVAVSSGVQDVSLVVGPAPPRDAEGPLPISGGGSKTWIWATVGGVLGAALLVALVNRDGSDDDECIPTTSPVNPCP